MACSGQVDFLWKEFVTHCTDSVGLVRFNVVSTRLQPWTVHSSVCQGESWPHGDRVYVLEQFNEGATCIV
jgi:hypothetical protein